MTNRFFNFFLSEFGDKKTLPAKYKISEQKKQSGIREMLQNVLRSVIFCVLVIVSDTLVILKNTSAPLLGIHQKI